MDCTKDACSARATTETDTEPTDKVTETPDSSDTTPSKTVTKTNGELGKIDLNFNEEIPVTNNKGETDSVDERLI